MEILDPSILTFYAALLQLFKICFSTTMFLKKMCIRSHAQLFLVDSAVIKCTRFVPVTQLCIMRLSHHAMYWQHPKHVHQVIDSVSASQAELVLCVQLWVSVSIFIMFATSQRPASRWATREYLNLSAGFAGDDRGRGRHCVFLYGNEGRAHLRSLTNPSQHLTQRYFSCSGSVFLRP